MVQEQTLSLNLTGTATDYVNINPNIDSIAASIENTTTNTYWNGTSWSGTATTNTYPQVGLEAPSTGGAISNPVIPLSAMTSGDTYTITASITDVLGFSSSPSSSSFAYNASPISSVTISSPTTGASYGQNWSGAISGTASSANGVSSVSVSVEDLTYDEFWNGTSFTATYTTVPATGTASWSTPLSISCLLYTSPSPRD